MSAIGHRSLTTSVIIPSRSTRNMSCGTITPRFIIAIITPRHHRRRRAFPARRGRLTAHPRRRRPIDSSPACVCHGPGATQVRRTRAPAAKYRIGDLLLHRPEAPAVDLTASPNGPAADQAAGPACDQAADQAAGRMAPPPMARVDPAGQAKAGQAKVGQAKVGRTTNLVEPTAWSAQPVG